MTVRRNIKGTLENCFPTLSSRDIDDLLDDIMDIVDEHGLGGCDDVLCEPENDD